MCFIHEASYTAACLLIISEILNQREDIKYVLFKGQNFGSASKLIDDTSKNLTNRVISLDDDDEEHFIDIDRIDELKKQSKPHTNITHVVSNRFSTDYYPFKRDPRFANAENTPMWELVMLSQHSHPTVRLWAN